MRLRSQVEPRWYLNAKHAGVSLVYYKYNQWTGTYSLFNSHSNFIFVLHTLFGVFYVKSYFQPIIIIHSADIT